MTSVVVDLDDLETLVITTGALKTVEQALNARKSDPFVRAHLDFTDAHDRLASQMRNARRSQNKDTVIEFDGKLTDTEIMYLTKLEESPVGYFLYHDEKYAEPRANITNLQAKGMIRRGRYLNGVLWDGETHPQLKEDVKGFAVKLTQRGKETVWKYWTEKEKL